ncbi:MAG: hypothetical protein OJI70_00505 [Zavarzinia sp.]|nr:hypothetical protein [Zavarzinia sp.]
MLPALIGLAVSVLPDIVKVFAGKEEGKAATKVADIVKTVTGAETAEAAEAKVTEDPAVARQLRVELAKMVSEHEIALRQIELDRTKALLDAQATQQQGEIKALALKLDAIDSQQKNLLAQGEADNADTAGARSTLVSLVQAGSPAAWGAPIVSVVVTAGFLVILLVLIGAPDAPSLKADAPTFQMINITVGALAAAFATVVNFWLGSSQGSRIKDMNAAEARDRQDRQFNAALQAQSAQVADVLRTLQAPIPVPASTESNFKNCARIVMAGEGGGVNSAVGAVGPAKYGIGRAMLADWHERDVTPQEVEALAEADALEIYRTRFWNLMQCDALPRGVDLAVFDFGVVAGPKSAVKALQKIAGVDQDGSVGPVTLAALKTHDPATVARRLCQARLDLLRDRPDWATNSKLWSDRTDMIAQQATTMAAQAKPT